MSRAGTPRPWNEYGLVRGFHAPPRRMRAPSRDTQRAVSRSCSRDSTAHGPAITTSSDSEADLDRPDPDPGALARVLDARQLVRGADPDDLVDAGQRAEVADALDVADDADHGALLADRQERLEAVLLDASLDPVDLLLRRRWTHHHDHPIAASPIPPRPSTLVRKQKTQELSLPASAGTSACAGEIYSPASYPLAVKPRVEHWCADSTTDAAALSTIALRRRQRGSSGRHRPSTPRR